MSRADRETMTMNKKNENSVTEPSIGEVKNVWLVVMTVVPRRKSKWMRVQGRANK